MSCRHASRQNLPLTCAVFPEQLEWSMKLWWPHCEAMVAFLMAYSRTRRPELLDRFSQVFHYTFSHVSLLQRQPLSERENLGVT